MDAAAAAVYADVLRAPERAAASAALYRAVPAPGAARARRGPAPGADRRAGQAPLPARRRRAGGLPAPRTGGPHHRADVEVVDGSHFLADLRPEPGRGPRPRVVRLITWNVARRARTLVAQATAVGAREPDLLALQEITARTWPLWAAACATLGLPHVRCSLAGADPAREPAAPRRHGVLLASREPLAPCGAARRPVAGDRPRGAVRGARGARRARPERGQRRDQAARRSPRCAPGSRRAPGPRVLCGDLNTPRRELPDGTVWSFARDWQRTPAGGARGLLGRGRARRRARPARPRLHRRVPRVARLRVARRRAGRGGSGHGGGWRLDHVLQPGRAGRRAVPPRMARTGLSDHSALEVDLA